MAQVKPTADVVEMSVGALFEWDGLEACYEFVQDALSVPALEIVKVHAARYVRASIWPWTKWVKIPWIMW